MWQQLVNFGTCVCHLSLTYLLINWQVICKLQIENSIFCLLLLNGMSPAAHIKLHFYTIFCPYIYKPICVLEGGITHLNTNRMRMFVVTGGARNPPRVTNKAVCTLPSISQWKFNPLLSHKAAFDLWNKLAFFNCLILHHGKTKRKKQHPLKKKNLAELCSNCTRYNHHHIQYL